MLSAGRRDLAVLLLAAAAAGSCGIRWGLPGPERLRAFPPRLVPTPAIAERFANEWAKLYEGIREAHKTPGSEEPVTHAEGVEVVEPGWDFPPPKLMNSYRGMLLQTGHPDEKKSFIILAQMRPWKFDFQPLYVQYGGAFIYPLGAFLGALKLLGLATITSNMSHYLLFPADMGRLYLGGRLFMLLFQLATVFLLYALGVRLSGRAAGAAAAVLGFLTPFAAINTHMLKPHPYSAFWALAAVWFLLDAAQRRRRRDFLLCGACAGMAAGSLFSLVPLLGLPCAGLLAGRAPRPKDALAGVAAGLAVFLLANPYALFAFSAFKWDLAYASGRELTPGLSRLPDFFSRSVPSLGLVATVLGLAGPAVLAFGRDREKALLARGFWLLTAVLWVKFAVFFADDATAMRLFYAPVLLSFVLGAAWLADSPAPRALKIAVFALLLAETSVRGANALANLREDSGPASSFARAADWLDANLPDGAEVGLPRYPEASHTPPFRWDRARLVVFQKPAALDGRPLPRWVVLDRMDAPGFDAWNGGRYRLAASFGPRDFGPVRFSDCSPYVNQEIRVYEKTARISP